MQEIFGFVCFFNVCISTKICYTGDIKHICALSEAALAFSIHMGTKAYTLYEFILILGSIVLWAKDFKWNNENLLKRTS